MLCRRRPRWEWGSKKVLIRPAHIGATSGANQKNIETQVQADRTLSSKNVETSVFLGWTTREIYILDDSLLREFDPLRKLHDNLGVKLHLIRPFFSLRWHIKWAWVNFLQRRRLRKEWRGLLLLLEDGGSTQGGALTSLQPTSYQRQCPKKRTSESRFLLHPYPVTIGYNQNINRHQSDLIDINSLEHKCLGLM